jgi:metal-responsive CopG/Arc/MetJ family transcriptional regulator
MKHGSSRETGSERLIFTLPRTLVAELEKYARALRAGNKSGFVADALRSYIDQFRRRRHTQLLRDSYAQAAAAARAVQRQWESLDEETWARLEEAEAPRPPRR